MNQKLTLSLKVVLIWSALLVSSTAYAQPEDMQPFGNPYEGTEIEMLATPAPTPSPVPFPKLSGELDKDFLIHETKGQSGRIAFTVKVGKYQRILELDLDSKVVRALIDGPGNNRWPSWSPDGSKLAFASDRDGNPEIYLANWDGSNQQRLTYNRVTDGNPTWMPDSETIVYYSDTSKLQNNRTTNLFKIGATSGLPEQITNFTGRNTTPKVSPDGKLIAYSTNRYWPGWDICLWRVNEKREDCILTGKQTYCRPAWDPQNSNLSYSYGLLNNINLGVMYSKTKKNVKVSSLSGREYDSTWSGDGEYIAFVAEPDSEDNFDIYILLRASGKTFKLLESPFPIRYLSWSAVSSRELAEQQLRAEEIAKLTQPDDEQPQGAVEGDALGGDVNEALEEGISRAVQELLQNNNPDNAKEQEKPAAAPE